MKRLSAILILVTQLLSSVSLWANELVFDTDTLMTDTLSVDTISDPEWYVAPVNPEVLRAPMRSAAAASCPTDSIFIFNIDSVLTEVTIFAYDDAGHTISEVVWTVNADGSRVGKTKKEDRYEGSIQVMTSTYVWDNTTSNWIGNAKTEYEFTDGKNTATTVFDWLNGAWSAVSKQTYVYDAAGRETEYTTYARNAAGQLEHGQRREKTYSAAGQLILDVLYGSYANGAWVGSSKFVYDYNTSGAQTLYEYYSSYSNGAWVGSTKNVYNYDAAGNKVLEEKYSGMTNGVWKGSSKYTATFNAQKKETEHIAYKWNNTSKIWQNNTRITNAYDGDNVMDNATYTWSNAWVGKTRTSKTYSGTLVLSEIVWKWSNGWVHNTKTETQYDGTSSRISVQTKSVWKSSAWVNVSQVTNTYQSTRLMESYARAWRNGAWQDSARTVNTYDAKNINTLSVVTVLNGSAWISTDSTTRELAYATIAGKELMTEDVSMKWTSTTNKWKGVKRETKEYDASGNVTQSDTYSWVNNTGWINNVRRHYAYKDGNKNLETLNDYLTWNKTANVWVGISRTEKAYDATNRQVKTSSYKWNATQNDWEGLSSSEDVYENGIKVTSYSYKWDYTDWQWIGMLRHDYTYEGSKIKEQIDWRYNKTAGWYYDTKVINTYDSKGRTIETMRYGWVASDSQWCMTSINKTTYDADAEGGRLREQLDATGSNCAVTSYALQHYMYACDLHYYTIRFVDYDGTEITSSRLEEGQVPSFTGEQPSREEDAQYTYTFSGWDKELSAVTGNTTYIATYSATTRSYTITFKNGDEVLQSTSVEYGVIPTYNGATPIKNADAQYTYTFNGWDSELSAVTEDRVYTAIYGCSVNTYTITWLNDDNTQIDQTMVLYGVVPTHADATKPETDEYTYTFSGWDLTPVAVTGEATYTATFTATKKTYTITFKNGDEVLQSTAVEYGLVPTYTGATPSQPSDAQYSYSFVGWDVAPVAVTGEATYTAVFDSVVNTYTVIFYFEDGVTEIDRMTLPYGATPSTNYIPGRNAEEHCYYSFAGWYPEIAPVTDDASYTPTYTVHYNEYTIIFRNYDRSELQRSNVPYGTMPSYDGAEPVRPRTAQYTYTFAGWTPELAVVDGNATYTATYESTVNSYTIIFLDEDGTELDRAEVAYGQVPSTAVVPTKEPDEEYTYTFAGWSPRLTKVTSDATYTATYRATPKTDGILDNIRGNYEAIKVLINGMIYIRRGDKTYTPTGVLVE
ncbi:MAG: hypothetical protein IK073_06870 [Paludibacteraceae bacterium]|nr:hypothetical protein [Paludibacteraceae bacterium]